MSSNSRVLWSQGVFLQPHHFQQMERSLRTDTVALGTQVRSHPWGFSGIGIDPSALRQSQFTLNRCAGRFPDGVAFDAPGADRLPQPIVIDGSMVGKTVYLGVPLQLAGQSDFVRDQGANRTGRFAIRCVSLPDNTDQEADEVEIEVGELVTRLLVGEEATAGFSVIPIATIGTINAEGVVSLSEQFIPTVLTASALEFFRSMLRDIHARMLTRARSMAGRSVSAGRLASTEHFLEATTLMAMNRYLPVFDELASAADVHPHDLYLLCAQAAGELSTFAAVTSSSPRFEPYRHGDLYRSFTPVLRTLLDALGQVIQQSATQIALTYLKHGIYRGVFPEPRLLAPDNQFVLCVTSSAHPDELRQRFPAVVKVASAPKIIDHVNNLIPGVPLHLLGSAPPEIRFPSSRTVYFELDSSNPLWEGMGSGIAVHVADEFAGLKMELWVISHDT